MFPTRVQNLLFQWSSHLGVISPTYVAHCSSACSRLTLHHCFSGSGLKRLEYRTQEWDVDFTKYLEGLRTDRPVIVTGDLNCAREPIDIHNAKGNLKSAGFTPEERESFQKVKSCSLAETFTSIMPGMCMVYGILGVSIRTLC